MKTFGMIRPRPTSALRLLGGAVVAMLVLPGAPAAAQGKLDARYEVTLAGIPVGKGSWVVDIADDQYSASASGGTSGRASDRVVVVTASARSWPALTRAITPGMVPKITYICPPSRSAIAGATPR